MFIEQARASFEIWFKIKPDINTSLINNIKKKLVRDDNIRSYWFRRNGKNRSR